VYRSDAFELEQRRHMTTKTTLAVSALAIASAVSVSLVARQAPGPGYPPPKPQPLATALVARGAQLVMLGGCEDCHTPKGPNFAPDAARRLSGHPQNAPLPPDVVGGISTNMMLTAWRGPWGVSMARNLTPDKETGIGEWTLADFKKALRTGVNKKGETLLPPMPVMELQNLPEQDLEAIWAYLRTLKPVRNAVGKPVPPK
jgi:mono/diheme cytochrome c family protein